MFDLQRFIKEKKITQIELSETTGLDRSQLNRIINGKAELTFEYTEKISEVYPDFRDYKIEVQNDNLKELLGIHKKLVESLEKIVESNGILAKSTQTQTEIIRELTRKQSFYSSIAAEP